MASFLLPAFKSAILSSTLLCLGISAINNEIEFIIIPICFISIVITFLIASIMIAISIVPFYEFPDDMSAEQKFQRYFPYYAIVYFIGCFCISYASKFELYTTLIFGITYITAMQAWAWYFKQHRTIL